MFLDNLERKNRIQKKMFRENCSENVVSEIYKKDNFCPQNPPKILNAFMVFLVFVFFFLKVILWKHKLFVHKFETPYPEQFP